MLKIILRGMGKVSNDKKKFSYHFSELKNDKKKFSYHFLALKNEIHFGIRTVEGRYSTFFGKERSMLRDFLWYLIGMSSSVVVLLFMMGSKKLEEEGQRAEDEFFSQQRSEE